MRVLLVPQALRSEPRVRPEHRPPTGEEGLRQDLVNRVRDPAGADLPNQVRPDILAEQDCRLDPHGTKTYACTCTQAAWAGEAPGVEPPTIRLRGPRAGSAASARETGAQASFMWAHIIGPVPNITLSVPDDLHRRMRRHPEVK